MGERVLNDENSAPTTQGIFETSTITTTTSLPPFFTTVSTSTHSPTFDQVMNQPITSLFPSQSTVPPKTMNDDDTNDGLYGASFADLEFNPEEEDIPFHMFMSGK
ncbi:unnamed protein product [Lactuca saligna]|uniref:Uncharacterized protein n=1 Tax=Lactuca saligna TaxID=75948 RepID=A0AA35YE46_LACSI|nr:unnamed protein product [Lactuca saligna]